MLTRSIRVRLAAWHTLAVAVLLAVFSGGTWLFVTRTARARADRALVDLTRTFVDAWVAERGEERGAAAGAAADVAREFRSREQRVLVFDAAGRLVAASDSMTLGGRLGAPLAPLLAAARAGRPGGATFEGRAARGAPEGPVRARATPVAVGRAPFTVVALRSMRAEHEALETFGEVLAVAVPLALVLAAAGGYWLARASLAPAVAMGRRAAEIGERTLHTRLPVHDPRDELGQLAAAFNALLARVETAFARQAQAIEQQRQFMADASHELRTPVAGLTTVADVALARPDRTPAELTEALDVIRGEGRRLARIVDELLLLARADAGQLPVGREPLYLEEVVDASVRAARAVAAARGVALETPLADEAPFVGDPHLLRRLASNLIDNAIKYTPPGGRVRVALDRVAADRTGAAAGHAAYAITVEDTGCGIAPADQARVFERFFRADPARTRGDGTRGHAAAPAGEERPGGAGLGLAIAQWIAVEHGGTVALAASGPAGSRFVVTLPIPSA